MAFAKVVAYEMDRRQLLRMTGTMGIATGATYILPHEAYAANLCDKIVVDNGSFDAIQAGGQLQYWIDGLHFGARSNLKSRANLTFWMDLKQTPDNYVESVVLMDPTKKTIAARFFDASMKMSDERVPYVTFDNIELDHTNTYYVVYAVRSGSKVKLYSSRITNPEISRLNTTFLPQKMRNDFKTFLVGTKANPTPGLITTQYQFYTLNGLSAHTARGRVKDMAANGASFTVNIDFMHGDSGAEHYMRYFIVMDPVGRLLGFFKRSFGDGKAVSLDVGKLTQAQIDEYQIPPLQIGNIADCPYIQIFTEDSYDAIARSVIRFR